MGFNVANERVLRDISAAEDGMLHIRISTVIGTPSLSALQILHGTPHRQLPIRIVLQPTPGRMERASYGTPTPISREDVISLIIFRGIFQRMRVFIRMSVMATSRMRSL